MARLTLVHAAGLAAAAAIGSVAAVAAVLTTKDANPTTAATTTTVTVAAATQAASTSTGSKSVNQIYRENVDGVVEIKVRSTATQNSQISPFGPQQQTQEAQGTGFEIDKNGDIATNAHVVSGASSITVQTNDGTTYKATLVGSDETTDVAVIHISAPAGALHPISFGNSSSVAVGDAVVAIGDPYGLAETVTTGIVSALNRTITSPNNHPIRNAIQTDAAINHGNSGGPLFNDQGQVIGITSQIYSDQTSSGNVGIGFAVPSSTVKQITSQLITTGKASHPYIGIYLTDISNSEASDAGIASGIEITKVKSGSPGDSAGLKASTSQTTTAVGTVPTGGDFITAVNGHMVTTANQLISRISTMKPGDKVDLTVLRGGQTINVLVTLGSD